MKYIRTKDRIYEVKDDFIVLKGQELYLPHFQDHVIKQADTIEELIQDNDILYIHDLYPDSVLVVEGKIKPFGYQEAIKLKDWLENKTDFDLYIRQKNGNYHLVAKMNDKGELELL